MKYLFNKYHMYVNHMKLKQNCVKMKDCKLQLRVKFLKLDLTNIDQHFAVLYINSKLHVLANPNDN